MKKKLEIRQSATLTKGPNQSLYGEQCWLVPLVQKNEDPRRDRTYLVFENKDTISEIFKSKNCLIYVAFRANQPWMKTVLLLSISDVHQSHVLSEGLILNSKIQY